MASTNKFNDFNQRTYNYAELEKEAMEKQEQNQIPVEEEQNMEHEEAKKSLVINAFGGPGAGKTTACHDIVSELKKRGYTAEYVPEYAKELVYEKNWVILDGSLENQRQILAEQSHRLERLQGQVDFIVTDAPLLLNSIYCSKEELTPAHSAYVKALYEKNENFNIFINRDKEHFEAEGRLHNLEESMEKDNEIRSLLKENEIFYGIYRHDTVYKAIDNVVKTYCRINGLEAPAPERDPDKAEFRGMSYKKDSKNPTYAYGASEAELITKFHNWNIARSDEDKFRTVYIGRLNENNQYAPYSKFEVETAKNITEIDLKLPSLDKEDFKKLTAELKENGAKFNGTSKKWYILPDNPNKEYFAAYTAAAEAVERLLPKEELVKEAPLAKEESQIKEREYYVSVGKEYYDNRCTVYFTAGSSVNIYGDDYGVHFPSLKASEVSDIVEKFVLPGMETEQTHRLDYQVGEEINILISGAVEINKGNYIPTRIMGKVIEAHGEDPDPDKIDMRAAYITVQLENGIAGNPFVEQMEIYRPAIYTQEQAAVLQRALESEIKLSNEHYEVFWSHNFTAAQMEEILFAFRDGLDIETVRSFAVVENSSAEMDLFRYGLQNGLALDELVPVIKSQEYPEWTDKRVMVDRLISRGERVAEQDQTVDGKRSIIKNLREKQQEIQHSETSNVSEQMKTPYESEIQHRRDAAIG